VTVMVVMIMVATVVMTVRMRMFGIVRH